MCSTFFIIVILLCKSALGAPRVIVSIRPLHSLTANMMEGVGQPELLIGDRQSPHTFHLKPSDVGRIRTADLVVWVGPQLEFFLQPLEKSMQHQLQMLNIEGMHLLSLGKDKHHHGHHADPTHPQHMIDPHLWLNPKNAKLFVATLAKLLTKIDPSHKSEYEKNEKALMKKLDDLDRELKTALQPYSNSPFLVFHDSLQYFAEHYNLGGLQVMTANPELPITVKQFKDSETSIQRHKIQCLFQEPQFDLPIVKRLAIRTGIQVGTLDPLGIDSKTANQAYFVMMQNLVHELTTCLSQRKSG